MPPPSAPPHRPATTMPGGGPYQQQHHLLTLSSNAIIRTFNKSDSYSNSSYSNSSYSNSSYVNSSYSDSGYNSSSSGGGNSGYRSSTTTPQQTVYHRNDRILRRRRQCTGHLRPIARPPAIAPPGTINPSDLQQALGPAPTQISPGPARPASNPPPPVLQQLNGPPPPPVLHNTVDLTLDSPTKSNPVAQPRPQVRSTPPSVQHPRGGHMQQTSQRAQQQQQQSSEHPQGGVVQLQPQGSHLRQHPSEYQRQQAEYYKRLQYQQQQQRQQRPSNNMNGGGEQLQNSQSQNPQSQKHPQQQNPQQQQFQNPQQPQPQQQQLILSFDASNSDDYTKEELDKDTADLTAQLWFPELDNQYFPSYTVPTWMDLDDPGPIDPGPQSVYESRDEEPDQEDLGDETGNLNKKKTREESLLDDGLVAKVGCTADIPRFYTPCEFCTWLRSKTGQGGHCFPSFPVRDATGNGEDSAPGHGGRRVTPNNNNGTHAVRPKCTTCVGFGIETCTLGEALQDGPPRVSVAREAEYMQNMAVRDLLTKPPLEGMADAYL
ncbi:hypothetical protein PG988_001473 [Apiospora saccharicola]